MATSAEPYLSRLLDIHWLRPETALWRTFDCLLAEQHACIEEPAIDLGCGDGTLSYIMAGGNLPNYDVFLDVGHLGGYNQGADIHDVSPVSTLDVDDSALRYAFSLGVDHKRGLVEKARRLSGFYHDVEVHDLNGILPLPSEAFGSLFSNVLYWLEDLDSVLREWQRILRARGRLTVFVPNHNFKSKAWLYYSAPHVAAHRYLNYFDRGYAPLIRHCYSRAEWTAMFRRNGFAVIQHQAYLTDPVMDVWNVGTRPIAPLLVTMANRLLSEDRQSVKRGWVDYFRAFMRPIVEGEYGRVTSDDECAFHFYVLEKH